MTDLQGVVLSGTGGIWTVLTSDAAQHDVSLRGRMKKDGAIKLAVGDNVTVEQDERDAAGAWAITAIHPRRSLMQGTSQSLGAARSL